MKYKNFLIRLISLLLVVGSLWYYNAAAWKRQEIVEAHEQKIAEAEAYNESVMALEQGNSQEDGANGAAYQDGTYEGTGIGFGGEVSVSVTIMDGKIANVEILAADDEDPAYFDMAKVLTDTIVKEQNAQLDVISGATFSSNGILEAAQDALSKAVSS